MLTGFALIGCASPSIDGPVSEEESLARQQETLNQLQGYHGTSRALKKAYLQLAFNNVCPPVPVPGPNGWGPGDQAGNTNTQGAGTACRAGILQSLMANGKLYRLDQIFESGVSPKSPFGAELTVTAGPTFCLEPGLWPYPTYFCGHSDFYQGDFGGQGTQLDFFGHAGRRADPLDSPSATVFYNGFEAPEVQAGALGADTVKPINTIGILLDARKLNGGTPLGPQDVVTKAHVLQMLHDQDLEWLGIQPGMVVFIYTGKGDSWSTDTDYYSSGPGLSVDVVTDIYVPNHVVFHGLDNPFSDQADLNSFVFLSGSDPLDPFPIHTTTLTSGMLQAQNLNLEELAADEVYLFSLQMAAPRIKGAKGSMVSPTAFGSKW